MPLVLASFPPSSESTTGVRQHKTMASTLRPVLSSIGPSMTTDRRTEPTPSEKQLSSSSSNTATETSTPAAAEEESPCFPTATIDAESISDVMAARLAICLLGHVLFLKSQIPFPVAQLLKMASSKKTDPRANKKQVALLASFDLLSSHLGSTFTALAVALSSNSAIRSHSMDLATAHLAIVLGPTALNVNAARARIVMELEGFRVPSRIATSTEVQPCITMNRHLKENDGVPRVRSTNVNIGTLSVRSKGLHDKSRSAIQVEIHDDDSDEGNLGNSDVEDVPDSDPGSDSTNEDSDSDSDNDSEDDEDSSEIDETSFVREETEADLCTAERVFSRTLAIANADPEHGMAAELRPTQTHILLRAPRRFAHPAWIPRQNLSRDMDPVLRVFHERGRSTSDPQANALHDMTGASQHNGKSASANANAKRKEPGGIKTECVRVRCRGADPSTRAHEMQDANESRESNDADTDEIEDAEDEMIWWSWDGELEGFADW